MPQATFGKRVKNTKLLYLKSKDKTNDYDAQKIGGWHIQL